VADVKTELSVIFIIASYILAFISSLLPFSNITFVTDPLLLVSLLLSVIMLSKENAYKKLNFILYAIALYIIFFIILVLFTLLLIYALDARRPSSKKIYTIRALLIIIYIFMVYKITSTVNEVIRRKLSPSIKNLFLYSFSFYRKKVDRSIMPKSFNIPED
jgi:hypothetical protein